MANSNGGSFTFGRLRLGHEEVQIEPPPVLLVGTFFRDTLGIDGVLHLTVLAICLSKVLGGAGRDSHALGARQGIQVGLLSRWTHGERRIGLGCQCDFGGSGELRPEERCLLGHNLD